MPTAAIRPGRGRIAPVAGAPAAHNRCRGCSVIPPRAVPALPLRPLVATGLRPVSQSRHGRRSERAAHHREATP
ncbi:hypothetical protein ACFPRL_13485 [Pseudoclavibacter helvolus]